MMPRQAHEGHSIFLWLAFWSHALVVPRRPNILMTPQWVHLLFRKPMLLSSLDSSLVEVKGWAALLLLPTIQVLPLKVQGSAQLGHRHLVARGKRDRQAY